MWVVGSFVMHPFLCLLGQRVLPLSLAAACWLDGLALIWCGHHSILFIVIGRHRPSILEADQSPHIAFFNYVQARHAKPIFPLL